jgi:putative transposase
MAAISDFQIGRMPRPQESMMEFSSGKNANWPVNSVGSDDISSGHPVNAGQRQVVLFDPRAAGPSGHPANVVVLRRYTFKLYPNKAQAAAMQRQAALLAQLWNAALEQRETQWAHECQRKPRGERKGLGKFDQSKELKFIRADDPEYAAMSADTMNLCIVALDDAFKAFFKRAKGGAGKSSGYPRYKSPYAIEHKGVDCTIWHRDAPKGWRMERARKHFRIHAHGISNLKDRSTWIKARGRFPVDFDDLEVRDMRLIRVGGIWQLSVVVRMESRREKIATAPKATVDFDLIDEFASVKTGADGECLPGWADEFLSSNERISPENHGVNQQAAEGSPETGADGRRAPGLGLGSRADANPGTGASDRSVDHIQSEGDTRFKRGSYRWRQNRKRVARRKAKEARQRKEALHRWTTRLVAGVSELTVVCPPIKEHTKSARGNEKNHGAAVKTVAMINRHVLAQAPAMAIQMIEYKSAEAGIPFARVTPDEHALAIGRVLPKATKAARKAGRQLQEMEA